MQDQTGGTTPTLTVDGPRATILLARPKQLNKLTGDDLTTLLRHFNEITSNSSIRALVLTGEGRVFSAGYDLNDIAARTAAGTTNSGARRSAFEEVVDTLEDLPVPTICRLNGGVYGGATDLALACDFRIGVDTCEMFMPAARLGLHYYKSGIVRYVSRLGVAAAKKLFLTAQKIDAAEMQRIGYLDEIASAGELDRRVDALATLLAGNAPVAMRGMKAAINEIARQKFDESAADIRHHASLSSDELREGAAAFVAKRAPKF